MKLINSVVFGLSKHHLKVKMCEINKWGVFFLVKAVSNHDLMVSNVGN